MKLQDVPPSLIGRLLGETDSPRLADDLARRIGAKWSMAAPKFARLRGQALLTRLTSWAACAVRDAEPRFLRVAVRAVSAFRFRIRARLGDGGDVTFHLTLGSSVAVEDA